MLTKQETQALAAAVEFWRRCLPPENRNVSKNGTLQPAYDKLRLARGALRRLRAADGVAVVCGYCGEADHSEATCGRISAAEQVARGVTGGSDAER